MKSERLEQWIPPVKAETYPKRLLFIDTETQEQRIDSKKHYFKLRLGIAIYVELDKQFNVKKRVINRFYNIDEFTEMLISLLRKKSQLYVFAHNIKFDIMVLNLPHELYHHHFTSTPPIINNMVFMWNSSLKGSGIKFLDTANFGVTSVAQLGDDLGFPKLSIDYNTQDTEKLFEYCQRDVEIIEKFMLLYHEFIRKHNLGAFQQTLASQALTAWRKRFMSQSVYIHNYEKALTLERQAYHGGRVECWRIGEYSNSEFYNLDVNSMYPYVMDTFDLPYQLKRYETNLFTKELKAFTRSFYCIADVTLETDEPVYSILTNHNFLIQSYVWSTKRYEAIKIPKGRLLFPTGVFRAQLHDTELRYAIANNHIKYIHSIAAYNKAPIFKEYISFFNELKVKSTLEGNKSWRYISKLFSVSLYGKFGQMQVTRTKIGTTNPEVIWRMVGEIEETSKPFTEIAWFGDVYRELKEGESVYSSPAVAGAITAYARMVLYNYAKIAGFNNVFYMDTDSLIVNKEGYKNLVNELSSTVLGKLKLVSSGTELAIYGNKDYAFAGEIKHKGIPSKSSIVEIDRKFTSKKAEQLSINLGELQKEKAWEFLQFEGFLSWLNSSGNRAPIGTIKTKRRIQKYNKGIVDETGKVNPIVLSS